ncbi:MAG: glycosyltransferase family 39 protein, partial [Acetatifactor sp.]|nr:glycosyltransferase family 39 protein [Acetatifactor sp.]
MIIFLAGSLVRLLFLGEQPMGLHQDEAYSAYNSWAVMNYGIDSFGYTRPVYYTVWGSGMSVLYSYLTMPFFALFGISTITIRLPQAIMGSISIIVVYGLGKEMFHSGWMGTFFAFLMAINPWHIHQSRFGLDCNLAVPMLLLAMYFFCRYLNGKKKSFWGAAIFWGLTLYSYVLTWLVIPLILLASLIILHKKIVFDKDFFLPIFLLFVMAVPLLLFLAVNFDLIPEIRTELFSIPKLPA